LTAAIRRGLQSDVLLLSGGVSAGVLDLVPDCLRKTGVVEVFHKVNLKPGKPLWFGTYQGSNGDTKLIFGLPGNPVSSLVCFHLFVRPALDLISGISSAGLRRLTGILDRDFEQCSDRPTYFPGAVREENGVVYVTPLSWRGSADLRTLADANALIYFPPGNARYEKGSAVLLELV
jgi:molybdopterin molybdotransferase